MEQNEPPTYAPQTIPPSNNPFIIPVSIVLGLGLIAAALFFTRTPAPIVTSDVEQESETEEVFTGIRPVDETDHIRGNPNASLLIVEYADFDCPFCKSFQETMNQIITEYGPSGRVAWVYRHLPITKLHPNAKKIALASECVADLGGNDAFWEFSDMVYEGRTGSSPTAITNLNRYAQEVGVDVTAFNTCIQEERFLERVESDAKEAVASGAKGTPYSLILIGDQQGPLEGALSYDAVKQLIDTLLTQIDGGVAP